MGRERQTAKTGDVALYKARDKQDAEQKSKQVEDTDTMYDEVDRYNNARDELQQDMLRFGKDDNSSEEERAVGDDEENVFDLALDGSDESSSSDESSDDDDDSDGENGEDQGGSSSVQSSSDDDDDGVSSADEMDEEDNNILNWGKKKRDYYHGDTADLEIGQEEEDAELEEEAGKEVLKARLEEMDEDDFNIDDDEEDEEEDKTSSSRTQKKKQESISDAIQSKKRKSVSQLSKREKKKFLEKSHPELLPLISHFRDEMIRPSVKETLVVSNALFQNSRNAEDVGATPAGLQYLLSKAMLQTSTALNVCQYLLIKAENAAQASSNTGNVSMKDSNEDDFDMLFDTQEGEDIKDHPVITRLNDINKLSEKLQSDVEDKVPGLKHQIESLVKASAFMAGGEGKDSDDTSADGSEHEVPNEDTDAEEVNEQQLSSAMGIDSESSSSSEDDEEEPVAMQRRVMTEARFSHRPQDDMDETDAMESCAPKRQRRRVGKSFSDFGDDDDTNNDGITAAGRSLARTVNSISQRSKSRQEKSRSAPENENNGDDDERLKRGLEMMEAALGGDSEDEDDIGDDELDDGLDDDEDYNDFYSKIKQKSKAKKEFKKDLYAVAPKYPGFEDEVDGERAVGNMIMKNRGLVAHKAKINRNPRVKKREQYRKAIIRRKGAVRDVRTDEAHKYGGEETGIKSGLSRSRKL